MTEEAMDFMGFDPHKLRLTPDAKEAFRAWYSHRYPRDTAKHIARDMECDVRTAENIASGHLSATTLTRFIRAYGIRALAEVGAPIAGETYEQSIHRELEGIANERAELDREEQALRSSWARVRARRAVDGGHLRLVDPQDIHSSGEGGGPS